MPSGVYIRTEETKRKISVSKKGVLRKSFSESHRRNLSIALTGKPKTEEHKNNLRGSKIMITFICEVCKKSFKWYPSLRRKYCSYKCTYIAKKSIAPWNKGLTKETDERVKLRGLKHSQVMNRRIADGLITYNYGKDHHCWVGGVSREEYPWYFTDKLKEEIRKRDNYECQNCGMIEEEYLIVYGRKLDCHHIDYDKKNCNINNLITLCFSCNIRANNNRVYWEEYYRGKLNDKYKKIK